MKSLNIYIINNSHVSKRDMSGGEKIAMEFARRWSKLNNIFLCTSNIGMHIWDKYKVTNIRRTKLLTLKENSSVLSYVFRAIFGAFKLGRVKLDQNYENIIYSASDFWPDSIPAFFMKLKNKHTKWVAGFYLFAPKPWRKDSPYKGKMFLTGLLYYLTQLLIYWLVKRYADMVFVTSEPDVEKFVTKKRGRNKIVVIRGGVDIKPSTEYLNSGNVIPFEKRKYDACFVGRFHYQKGVLKLIDIWKFVCKQKPRAKLAIIGIGPLEDRMKEKIEKLGLRENIVLLGFKDREEKYEIFKQSKIVVHPATYDSGGMAACEAMAWGLPGVSFDLKALRTYYPKGMLKTPCFDLEKFASNILTLLEDNGLYKRIRQDAISWAREWDWQKRAEDILSKVIDITNRNQEWIER